MYEPISLACGNVVKAAALLVNSELLQQSDHHAMPLQCAIIALFVVAIARMASEDHHSIGAFVKRLQYKLRIDAAAAHYADNTYIRRIWCLRCASLVGAGVRAPVTKEADDPGLERLTFEKV